MQNETNISSSICQIENEIQSQNCWFEKREEQVKSQQYNKDENNIKKIINIKCIYLILIVIFLLMIGYLFMDKFDRIFNLYKQQQNNDEDNQVLIKKLNKIAAGMTQLQKQQNNYNQQQDKLLTNNQPVQSNHQINITNITTITNNQSTIINSQLQQILINNQQLQEINPNKYTSQQINILIQNTDLSSFYQNNTKTIHSITQSIHLQAIQLLQLNNQFKINAQYQILSTQQYNYYQYKYNISNYQQLPFCIIIPIYHSNRLKRNLISIISQHYSNYKLIYIDDNSPHNIKQLINSILNSFNLTTFQRQTIDNKITIIKNSQRKYALSNIYHTIHSYCNNNQIVVLVDGDDALIGRQVFKTINYAYHQSKSSKPLVVYSKYLLLQNNTASLGLVSRSIRPSKFIKNRLREEQVFYTSHLLTFSAGLFKQIHQQDLQDSERNFFKTTYDVAIMIPMLQMAYPHVKYLPQILYEYHYDGINNDKRQDQLNVSKVIYEQKKPYKKLSEQFISQLFP